MDDQTIIEINSLYFYYSPRKYRQEYWKARTKVLVAGLERLTRPPESALLGQMLGSRPGA